MLKDLKQYSLSLKYIAEENNILAGFNWNQAKLNAIGTQITDGFNWNQAKLNAVGTQITDGFNWN